MERNDPGKMSEPMTEADRDVGDRDLPLGELLRRLRGTTSLREVQRLIGISNAYLSQIEKGTRHPGPRILRRLAAFYGFGVHDLFERAGYLREEGSAPQADEAQDVERCYQFVMADPRFRVGTRPRGPLTLEAKRFIVEMYERFTGKRLLG